MKKHINLFEELQEVK